MVRWVPDTPERLQRAALDLFAARGYEQTTATEIAQAAGVTERTFFRHFSDKREVLFYGQQSLTDAFVSGVRDAPLGMAPILLAGNAVRSAAGFFPEDKRRHSRTRQRVIDDNPALQEREALKLMLLGDALGDALRDRDVDELTAAVCAQTGVVVFGITFGRWIRAGENRSFEELADEVMREVGEMTRPLHIDT
ncbi:TetR/AcrR family transcriptional regulator [Mycobacterium sp. WMMD1722]|uniref:TetR/AcrR family transcriptional regulator n=1 Tax=Mycobacterium sp. WMMD1722 TaxID=3404117 RepID=UPI003BF59ECE